AAKSCFCTDSPLLGHFAGLAFVLNRSRRFNDVAAEGDVADLFLQTDTDFLFALAVGPGIANRVVLEDQAAGLAADANAGGSTFAAVIFDQVLLQAVAVPGHALGFIAEKDAVFMVAADSVVPQQVVGVLVADRDAEAAVAFQQVLFKEAIL